MKKVLAMSILTMIVMSMGGCGASSDSSSSQDVSSKAETESNSPYTVEADFSKGASNDFSISAGWSNGDPFNCSWSEDNVTFNDGKMQLTIDSMGDSEAYRGGEYRSKENYGYGLHTQVHRRIILGTKLTLKSLARTQQRCSSITTPMVLASTNTCMILDLTLLRIFTLTHLSGKRTA